MNGIGGMRRLSWIAIGAAVVLLSSSVQATIVDGEVTGGGAFNQGGTFIKLTPPIGPVGQDNHQSPDLYGFDEDQNIVLADPLEVDIGTSPLTAGTELASHYVFFDPAPTTRLVGYVVFDSPVLAIVTSTENLIASDFLANVSATYLSPDARGLEAVDIVTIDPGDPNRINIDFRASSPGDYIRVLTARSPSAVCTDNFQCEMGNYCRTEPGACGTEGTCTPMPELCPDVWDPVCGCDGVTYPNDCDAAQAGVSVDFAGECEPTGVCADNADCDPAEYCRTEPGMCDAEGSCEPRPEVCLAVYLPVCGCDGVTYTNDCVAAVAGVSVGFAGPCGTATIDIKPGSDPNSVNPRSNGVIPVAVLTTGSLDAATVDPATARFGPDGALKAHANGHLGDVDGDGDLDLVLHFRTQETGISCGDTSATLTAATFSGDPIEGSDSIRTVGCGATRSRFAVQSAVDADPAGTLQFEREEDGDGRRLRGRLGSGRRR